MAMIFPSETPSLLGISVGGFIIWYLLSAAASWYRLRHIPGPFLASFSYMWLLKGDLLGRQAENHQSLKSYGRLVRTGPYYVVTDDPVIIRQIDGARSKYTRDTWYSGLKFDANNNMAATLDTVAHDVIKAKLTSGYSGRDGVNFEAGVNAQIESLVAVIKARYLSSGAENRPVDFAMLGRNFALDVITSLVYGKEFGFLTSEEDLYGYSKSTDNFIQISSVFIELPVLRWLIYRLAATGLLVRPTDKSGLGKVIG
jgi:hypothetical protein